MEARQTIQDRHGGFGLWSLENYEFIEEENMVGYVKYNMFHKEQHKPFKQDGIDKIYMDFGIFAISANLKKLLQIKRYEM